MQITSRFTAAIHILLCIAHYSDKQKVTSKFLSSSTGADPTIIRRLLGLLQTAGYVTVKAGVGGAYLVKPMQEITLFDIFRAIDASEDNLFRFYNNPGCQCPVGNNIHAVLDRHLFEIQLAMYEQMKKTNLQKLYEEIAPMLG